MPHLSYYPLTNNPFHLEHYSATGIAELLSELPDVESSIILGQLEPQSIQSRLSGRFLIFLALKAGGKRPAGEWRNSIERLLPFTAFAECNRMQLHAPAFR